jgi:carbon monoxide dehydrogenase subunit G
MVIGFPEKERAASLDSPKGGAVVALEAAGPGTKLTYDVEAQVGGKIAQLGSRIIDGVAKKMADQFFTNFAAAVGEEPSRAA